MGLRNAKLSLILLYFSAFAIVIVVAADRQFACRRRPLSSAEISNNGRNLVGPPSLPKSNLEISLDPLLISANFIYDHLQPRTDLFVSVIQNVTKAYNEIIANPTGPTTVQLITYYAGYVTIAVFLLFLAVVWPVVGFFFCCCRCCCKRCCYGQRGDIYSTRNKSGACRRCGCGFLFFLILLTVMGACIGCFISAVTFRFSTTSTSTIAEAAEATASAYNRRGNDESTIESYILVTERLGAAALDAVDSVRLLGYAYAKIMRNHVNDLTDSMMGGVNEIVERLSLFIDQDWLGGANSTLDEIKTLQQNITTLVNEMNQLLERHNEVKASVETCMYSGQRLKADISSACSETVSRECSRSLEQQLAALDIPAVLKATFDAFPRQVLDPSRIRNLQRQQVGDKAESLLNIYARDLNRIQQEAHRIASGSSVRQSIFTTLNSSLGMAAQVLQARSDNLASLASNQIVSLFCNGDGDDTTTNGGNNKKGSDETSIGQPLIAKWVRPVLDYTFYSLMVVASLIGIIVLFLGFSMLACCAGKSYYKRASCCAITAVAMTFLLVTVLAASSLVVFLASALTHSELCRPIDRQDVQMFALIDESVTDALVNGNFDSENGGAGDTNGKNWPPELIFASSSRTVAVDTWRFSLGTTLASCGRNATLMNALQLRLPQSRLADRLIKSVRRELQEATDDAILKIESRLDGIDEPSIDLQQALRELTSLQMGQWQMPQYPSQDDLIQFSSRGSISRLSLLVSKEIGAESSLVEAIKDYNSHCEGSLLGENLPWLIRSAPLIEARSRALSRIAQNLTQRIDSIVSKAKTSAQDFGTVLSDASKDLGNYLEVAARKKMGHFEEVLARDDSGRCTDAWQKVMATSEVVCRPMSVLSVFSLLLLGVVLITVPLIWCIGAPFAQALRWHSNPIIPGLNPQMNPHAAGFVEGLPLLDLLPRYTKIN